MLALNLNRIRTATERFDHVYEPGACAAEGDGFKIAMPVALGLDVYKDKDRFRLIGTVETRLDLTCSRCLEPFPWPVHASFDLLYQPRNQAGAEKEHVIDEDDFSTAFYENDTIDLCELMREQFYLALPMKPLCQDGCQGLCPICGTNLNRGACTCNREWEDPRFAALRALKRER
jgi:uncharacterized protein